MRPSYLHFYIFVIIDEKQRAPLGGFTFENESADGLVY